MLLMVFLAACAKSSVKKGPLPVWPNPPDQPRFKYESTLRSETSVVRLTREQELRQIVLGSNEMELIAYEKPYDVAARNGRIVVSDTMVNSLVLFDLTRSRLFRIGHLKEGRLLNPFGVAIDHLLNIYVADEAAKTVNIYDDVGFFLGNIGNSETLVRPVDVAVNPTGDRIYVVDNGGISRQEHRVVVFDQDGKHLMNIGTRGSKEGHFNLPIQAAVAPDGTLYVLDAGNFRVQAFDRNGNFLHTWGKVGRNIGDFARPRGIAVDDEGNVYVSDAAFRNFQIFNSKGQLLMWVGNQGLDNKPGQYAMPAGIAVDETNRVYIVDQLHRKIEVIRRLSDDEGKRLAKKYRQTQGAVASSSKPVERPASFSSTSLETSLDGMPPDVIIPTEAEIEEFKRKAAEEKALAEAKEQAKTEEKAEEKEQVEAKETVSQSVPDPDNKADSASSTAENLQSTEAKPAQENAQTETATP